MQIFIIDIDKQFGKSLQRLLAAYGLETNYTSSPGLFFDSVPFDQQGLVIADLKLIEQDDFNFFHNFYEFGYKMPIIVLTDNPKAVSRKEVLQKGAAAYLQKPFEESSLLTLIEELSDEIQGHMPK